LAQALIMMPSAAMVPDPMGIADEETTHPRRTAEGDHGAGALVAQIPDLAALPGAGFPAGSLQSPIAA